MSDSALVSIGIPCYNASETILRAINSALAQDWPNIEVIIVDDVSSDESTRIIEAAIANKPNIQLIRHKHNMGPAGSRNTILKNANGEFIVFFDDDDESLPNRVSEQIKTLTTYEARVNTTLIACYASGMRRYTNGYIKLLQAIGSKGEEAPNGLKVADYLLFYRRQADWFFGSGTPTCSLLARHSTFNSVGGFDSELRRVEDVDFAIRLAFMGGHFIGTSENLFIQYSSSAKDKSPDMNLKAEQILVEKNRSYLESIGFYYYAWHWPVLRYWHFRRRYMMFLWELAKLFVRYPLVVTNHLLSTGPKRIIHEYRMLTKNSG